MNEQDEAAFEPRYQGKINDGTLHICTQSINEHHVWLIDMAGSWWVQALHSRLETSLDLSKLPCFIIDSLVNICDLGGVHDWGDHMG